MKTLINLRLHVRDAGKIDFRRNMVGFDYLQNRQALAGDSLRPFQLDSLQTGIAVT
jgi:hypothetical protein